MGKRALLEEQETTHSLAVQCANEEDKLEEEEKEIA